MCLIFLALERHPRHRVILAANRDEFHERPTAAMTFWPEAPDILAGRDLAAGGTWLGIHRSGRWAALTNYRDPSAHRNDAASRGGLIAPFLTGSETAEAYLASVAPLANRYNGFNLLADDGCGVAYLSSRTGVVEALGPGIYGLSNHLLNTPWPKVAAGKVRFQQLVTPDVVSEEKLMDMLADRTAPPDASLPDTGVGIKWERRLGAIFIASAVYGTRCSTVMRLDRSGLVNVVERTYRINDGTVSGSDDRRFQFQASMAP